MKKVIFYFCAIIILLLAAGYLWEVAQQYASLRHPSMPNTPPAASNFPNMQQIFIKTSDALDIAADYYSPSAPSEKGAILLHMMPATRSSWRSFAPKLQELGYHVLAIDLRGHGESSGGPNGYLAFSDAEHQKSILDVEAALSFLEGKNVKRSQTVIIGASIGANLAARFLAEHADIPKAILLSPGLNYRGIYAGTYIANLAPGQAILLVGSDDDPQSNGAVMNQLADAAPAGIIKRVLVYRQAGHGTNMFGKESPDLAEEILNWLGK